MSHLRRKIVSIMKLAALVVFLLPILVKEVYAYTFTNVDVPGAYRTIATGINDNGSVVGHYYGYQGTTMGFIDNGSSYLTIDVPGATLTTANGINNNGSIVGHYSKPSGILHYGYGFIYNGTSYSTLSIPGSGFVYANGINNNGSIVGSYYWDREDKDYGFIYNGTSYLTIDVPGATSTLANGINDNGSVVGSYSEDRMSRWGELERYYHGFIYNGTSYLTIDVPGATSTLANGINDNGSVVGTYIMRTGDVPHGFIYNGTSYLTIDVPGAISTFANGINNNGSIVGNYVDSTEIDGEHGFIATVPEPSTILLLGSGIFSLMLFSRKRM